MQLQVADDWEVGTQLEHLLATHHTAVLLGVRVEEDLLKLLNLFPVFFKQIPNLDITKATLLVFLAFTVEAVQFAARNIDHLN